jgi:hypothetical protein
MLLMNGFSLKVTEAHAGAGFPRPSKAQRLPIRLNGKRIFSRRFIIDIW